LGQSSLPARHDQRKIVELAAATERQNFFAYGGSQLD
jgi:hypothetical protein